MFASGQTDGLNFSELSFSTQFYQIIQQRVTLSTLGGWRSSFRCERYTFHISLSFSFFAGGFDVKWWQIDFLFVEKMVLHSLELAAWLVIAIRSSRSLDNSRCVFTLWNINQQQGHIWPDMCAIHIYFWLPRNLSIIQMDDGTEKKTAEVDEFFVHIFWLCWPSWGCSLMIRSDSVFLFCC